MSDGGANILEMNGAGAYNNNEAAGGQAGGKPGVGVWRFGYCPGGVFLWYVVRGFGCKRSAVLST